MAEPSAKPWRIDYALEAVVDANGVIVARCDPETVDAETIAAAPEMLAMLRITRGNVASLGPADGTGRVWPAYQEWLRQLDVLIAKATGSAS